MKRSGSSNPRALADLSDTKIAIWQKRVAKLPSVTRFLVSPAYRALYVGFVGQGNLGDEVLYQAVQSILAGKYVFHTPSYIDHFIGTIGRLRTISAVFLGGGTLIGRGNRYLQSLRAAFEALPTIKFITFGTGVVDVEMWRSFGAPKDTAEWCELLERCEFLSVRGPLSKAHLQSWGFDKAIHVIGDPAMWYALPQVSPKHQRKRSGINLGPSKGYIFGQDEQSVLEFGARLLKLLEQEGWDITLFPTTAADAGYLQQAASHAGISARMHEAYLSRDKTLRAMEQQDVFIGEKLHSVVLANCAYTPAIMLEYRTKCRDYMLLTGQENLTYRTDRLDPDEIYAALVALYGDTSSHQRHLYDQMQATRTRLDEAAQQAYAVCAR